jgi:serine/threonine protein kinase
MRFLWTVAGILVKNAANSLGFGLGGSAVEIWNAWNKETPAAQEKLAQVQAVAQLSAPEARELAGRIVLELAADQPDTVRQQVAAILTQIPDATRRSLRRPEDPTGRSLRPSTVLDGPESVSALLPPALPRFKAGDTPLAGVDLELVELLGAGGFGEVWKARNPFLDGVQAVALKFCTDAEAARTLRHEAGVLNQVMRQGTHPGIVRLVHSYLRAEPPCLEYEHVGGGDLAGVIRDWHRSGAFSIDLACRNIAQLAEVVGFAHQLDPPVVHRDLKPANVLVQRGPAGTLQLKVADFGIGGIAASQAIKESSEKPAWHLTAMATGTCTPLYASPQQAAGQPADPRDDVYALGVLWFQMLTGNLSAGRPGGSAWRKRLAEQDMKAGLIELLEGCFEDDPDNRPQDAAVLAERLQECTGLTGVRGALFPREAVPVPSSRREMVRPAQSPEISIVETEERSGGKSVPTTRKAEELETYYRNYRERDGARPRAVQAYRDGLDPTLARARYGTWLRFVGAMGDLSARQMQLMQDVGSFLDVLESTPMTRSFKMLTLRGMLNLGALPGRVSIEALTKEFARLVRATSRLRSEVREDLDDLVRLRGYLEQSPIAAWAGGQGTRGLCYFRYERSSFSTAIEVDEHLRSDLADLVGELVDWRLAAYLGRHGTG